VKRIKLTVLKDAQDDPQKESLGCTNTGEKSKDEEDSRGDMGGLGGQSDPEVVQQNNRTLGELAITGKKQQVEKLTDFAYRETHNVRTGKGRNKNNRMIGSGRRVGGQASRNMGLVRVAPDTAKTPICPTFLRGTPCTNERCLKRHDVPREQFLPVCLFFQRHGLCLKENCPFRHVKVNPQAMPCPNFALLGFCEDAECPLLHMNLPTTTTTRSSRLIRPTK